MTHRELRRVLIIDDNPGDILLLERMLQDGFGEGLAIISAGSLGEGLTALGSEWGVLVLLDLFLPDSRGAATYRSFRKQVPRCPVVVLTGLQDESIALTLVREGAQDFLVKGQIDGAMLARSIQYAWERKQIERELVEKKAWWEALIQAIPEAVLIFDRDERVIFVNAAAEGLWDVPSEGLLGRDRGSLSPDEGSILTGGQETVPVEAVHVRFAVENQQYSASIYRDLTERRSLERQLAQTQKMEALGHLSAGIAHDFNNLLGVIIGHLDLLKKKMPEDAELLKRVEVPKAAAFKAAALTRRLLAFSRTQDLKPTVVSLAEVLESFLEMAQRTVGPDILLESRLDPSLPALRLDAGELENVLLNLTINARDAMPTGGTLRFLGDRIDISPSDPLVASGHLAPGQFVRLQVADTGSGMPPEVVEKAFEPFFTTKEKGKGTGLGLAMVYGFVRQSGGMVKIVSTLDEGTVIQMVFPVAREEDPVASGAMRASFRPRPGSRALVVDDEPELLHVARDILETLGFEVLTARDGPEALELLGTAPPPSLLVTDVLMPGGMNGGQLAQVFRDWIPGLQVIFTSGFPAQAFGDKRVTVDSVMVTKPYGEADFIEALHRIFPDPQAR